MRTRKTRIVATVGPPSIDLISKMAKYVDVFRLNFAHGDAAQHQKYFEVIRKKAPNSAILVDLPGPKMRIGDFQGTIKLTRGQTVVFSKEGEGIPVEEDAFYKVVQEGTIVLLADSEIRVQVQSVAQDKVIAKVISGGNLTARKGINIPKVKLDVGLTDSDVILLREAAELGADAIGLSFVVEASEVAKARSIYPKGFMVAKIEKADALKNLKEIIGAANAVMVARGDLGIEVGLERLPAVQDKIITASKNAGRPVILATQVLESMVSNTSPTRAEVIDVANSVSRGVDSIMLSDETAAGQNPMAAVKYLDGIIKKAELGANPLGRVETEDENDAMAYAAVNAARIAKAKAIVAHSRSGLTVARVSKFRPEVPILALVESQKELRESQFYWGVMPALVEPSKEVSDVFQVSWRKALELGIAKKGDKVVIVGGEPMAKQGVTNLLGLHQI